MLSVLLVGLRGGAFVVSESAAAPPWLPIDACTAIENLSGAVTPAEWEAGAATPPDWERLVSVHAYCQFTDRM